MMSVSLLIRTNGVNAIYITDVLNDRNYTVCVKIVDVEVPIVNLV